MFFSRTQSLTVNIIFVLECCSILKVCFVVSKYPQLNRAYVCLFLCMPSFEGDQVSLMGFSLMSGAGIDGNAPYKPQELQITTLDNPGIQTNFLPPRPVQS